MHTGTLQVSVDTKRDFFSKRRNQEVRPGKHIIYTYHI